MKVNGVAYEEGERCTYLRGIYKTEWDSIGFVESENLVKGAQALKGKKKS